MQVPEASVNENRRLICGKNYIGAAGKAPVMNTEAESLLEQRAPDGDFRLGVLYPNPRHHAAAYCRTYDIGHWFRLSREDATVGEL